MHRILRSCVLACAGLLTALPGCTAAVHSSPLSGRPDPGRGIYLSTGGAPRPFRTLGFIQLRGIGQHVAGVADVGDVGLDGVIKGTLATEAARMGGDGVIHIEFLDENPPTLVERASDLSTTLSGSGLQARERTVRITGEVIQFLDK